MLSDAVEANRDTISNQDGADGFHLSVPPDIGVCAATAYGAASHFRSPAGSFELSAEGHFVAVLLAASRDLAIAVGDGNMATLRAPCGTIVVAPIGCECRLQWSEPCEGVIVSLGNEIMHEIAGSEADLASWSLAPGLYREPDAVALSLAKLLRDELIREAGANGLSLDALLKVLGLHILRRYSCSSRREDVRGRLEPRAARDVQSFLQENFARKLSVSALAALAGLSTGRFIQLFKVTFGQSPHQYVLGMRLDYAENLLSDPDMSVAEAAYLSGFSNQSHLTSSMRKHRQHTPAEVQRSHRSRNFAGDTSVAQK